MLVKINLADFSDYSSLVPNQDNKLPAPVETVCFSLLLSSPTPFLSLQTLPSPPIHSKQVRKQEAEQKSKLKSPIQMPVCVVSSVSVRERQRSRERGKGRGARACSTVGRRVPMGQDLTLCLMASLLWGTMWTGSNRLTAVCTNFKLLATPLANTSVSCCKSSVTT